jgi:uncharacterized protein YcfL
VQKKLWTVSVCFLLLYSCVSRPAVDVWEDASLVAEQRAVIEEQPAIPISTIRRVAGDGQKQ